MGNNNFTNRNIDEYGGEPFHSWAKNYGWRGVNANKKAEVHPIQTAKRVVYRADGNGRDQYILQNNGGLSITNRSELRGTDLNTMY